MLRVPLYDSRALLVIITCMIICRFDILANGGGSVTLHFQRQPFQSRRVTVFVPWNRIMVMDVVTMSLDSPATAPASATDAADDAHDADACHSVEHDYYSLRPSVVSLWRHSHLPACSSADSSFIPETQVCGSISNNQCQLSLAIPAWLGAVSTGENWDVNKHTARCTGLVSVDW